ncbi:MFS transporter [Sulfurisphaera tokodaii str. 7]|uniref:MFS transporter n=2 Tax=Sulfurisphaera tokodaii TaxID=111955 RepID=Q96ZI2_SULTO|nr:MFS transporter [Sulfurisphaera tokodaii str. 7]
MFLLEKLTITKLKYSEINYTFMQKKDITFLHALLIIIPLTIAIRASNNMLMTTIPLVTKYIFNFSESEIGIISALTSLFTFIGSGVINSRLKRDMRKKVFRASGIVYAILLPIFYFASPITIWVLSALAGIVLGILMPNIITYAGLLKDRRQRERVLSIYTLALSASLVIGPAIESWILNYFSLLEVFLFFAPFSILSGIMSFFVDFPEERNDGKKTKVFENPGFITAVINILTYNIVFSILLAFAGIYAKSTFNISYSSVTLIFSAFFLTSFLSRLYLSIRPAERLWYYMSFAISITTLGLVFISVLPSNLVLFTVALLLLGIPHGITYPLSIISISRTFLPEERNEANSIFFAIMMLIGIVTPTISGFVIEIIGFRTTLTFIIPIILSLLVLLRRYVKYVDTQIDKTYKSIAK